MLCCQGCHACPNIAWWPCRALILGFRKCCQLLPGGQEVSIRRRRAPTCGGEPRGTSSQFGSPGPCASSAHTRRAARASSCLLASLHPPVSLLPASHTLTVWIHPRGAGAAGARKGCPWVRVGNAGAAEAEVNSTAANYSLHRAIKGVLFIKNTETRALRWELARAGAERPQGRRMLGAAVGAHVLVQCPAPCWETSWVSEVLSWNLASKGSARVCLNPADVCRQRAKLHLAASHRAVCRKPPPSSLLCRAGCRGCRRLFPPYSGLLFVLCPR